MIRFILILLMTPVPTLADSLMAAHTIPSRAVIGPADLMIGPAKIPGALIDPDQAIGMEARVVLYAGRPIRAGDLVPPALIDRNEIVILVFRRGTITIAAEGRSLDRGAAGDRVRVMNLASRTTVSGTVRPDGVVMVGPSEALLAQTGGG